MYGRARRAPQFFHRPVSAGFRLPPLLWPGDKEGERSKTARHYTAGGQLDHVLTRDALLILDRYAAEMAFQNLDRMRPGAVKVRKSESHIMCFHPDQLAVFDRRMITRQRCTGCVRGRSLGLRPDVMPPEPAHPRSRSKRQSIRSSIAAAHATSFSTESTLSLRWRSNTPDRIIVGNRVHRGRERQGKLGQPPSLDYVTVIMKMQDSGPDQPRAEERDLADRGANCRPDQMTNVVKEERDFT